MSDTTTTLFQGVGGDVMDESLVTQSDKVTQAKRPRVVPGGDDGSIQTFDQFPASTYADVKDDKLIMAMSDILEELKLHRVLLNTIIVTMGGDFMSTTELSSFDED